MKQGKPVYIAEWFVNKNDIEDNKIYGFAKKIEKAIQDVSNSISIDFVSGTSYYIRLANDKIEELTQGQVLEAMEQEERAEGLLSYL